MAGTGALTSRSANKRVIFVRLGGASAAFHTACFRCCECATLLQKPNAGVAVEWVDECGRPACAPCSKRMHQPQLTCRDCGERCDEPGQTYMKASDGGAPWCTACYAARDAARAKIASAAGAGATACGKICTGCGERCDVAGGDEWLECLGKFYHDACFACAGCRGALDPSAFYPVGNAPHCAPCAKAAKKRAKSASGGGGAGSSAAAPPASPTGAPAVAPKAKKKAKKAKKLKKSKAAAAAAAEAAAPPKPSKPSKPEKKKTKKKKKKKEHLSTASYCEQGYERCGACGMPFESGEEYTVVGEGETRAALHGRCFVCKGCARAFETMGDGKIFVDGDDRFCSVCIRKEGRSHVGRMGAGGTGRY